MADYKWIGRTSTDWTVSSNWDSLAGGVPGPADSVFISAGLKNYPVIGSGSSITVAALDISANASLTLDGTLTATTITVDGTLNLSNGTIPSPSIVTIPTGGQLLGFGAVNEVDLRGGQVVGGGQIFVTGFGSVTVEGSPAGNGYLTGVNVGNYGPGPGLGGTLSLHGSASIGVLYFGIPTSGPATTLAIFGHLTVQSLVEDYASTINMSGGTLNCPHGIQLDAGTALQGAGVVQGLVYGTGSIHASGGTLTLEGVVFSGVGLFIDGNGPANPASLVIASTMTSGAPIAITNAGSNLTIAGSGNLTINGAAQNITGGGTITVAGGTLDAVYGITVGSGSALNLANGTIQNSVTVDAGGVVSGTGTIIQPVALAGGVIEGTSSVMVNGGGLVTEGISGYGTVQNITCDGPLTVGVAGAGSVGQTLIVAGTVYENNVTDSGPTFATPASGINILEIQGNLVLGYAFNGAPATITTGVGQGILMSGGSITSIGTITVGAGSLLAGYGTLAAPLDGAGTVKVQGGTLDITGPVDAKQSTNFDVDPSSTLKFDGNVGSPTVSAKVTFMGSTATLDLPAANSSPYNVSVSGFVTADSIYVAPGSHATLGSDGQTLTVYGSGNAVEGTIDFLGAAGRFTGDTFQVAANGLLSVVPDSTICFMPGTHIATPTGEVEVQDLRIGDLVLTAEGAAAPVRWIGRQSIVRTFADALRVLPIRIQAGALGESVPRRDLLVSPDHALLVEGVLVQAAALVNGSSIRRETQAPQRYTYYHVELDEHALILAEGAPAETFIDNVQRLAFDNWEEHEALFPDGRAMRELPHARAAAARQVPGAVARLVAQRAQALAAQWPLSA